MKLIGTEDTLLSLFQTKEDIGALTKGVMEAVKKSFDKHAMNNPTHTEIKRRFMFCIEAAKIMRGDLKFGLQRLIAEFDNVLAVRLRGETWEPPTRACWIPSDGA